VLEEGLSKNSTKETQHQIPLDPSLVLQRVLSCIFLKL